MVENNYVYIFSGTKALYETLIKHEINELIKNNINVVIFLEFENKENFDKKLITVPIYRTNKERSKIKFFRIIYNSIKLKNTYLNTFKKYYPKILITHSDENFESILAIFLAKYTYKTLIIRRTPSVVINPQIDYVWQKEKLIKSIEKFFVKFIHNYFLMYLFTKKIHKSRLLWFPNNNHFYNTKRNQTNFDFSLCYSESCKYWLSKIGENAKVIKFPNFTFKSFNALENNLKSVLIVPSNDYLVLMKLKNLNIEEAAKFEFQHLDKIIKYFVDKNYYVSIKLRSNQESYYFNKFSIYSNSIIKQIEVDTDIYSIISNFAIIIGFNTSILWRQALYNSNQILISYQLLNHDLYNVFESHKIINFIYLKSNINTELDNFLLKEKISYSEETLYTMYQLIENILKNG